MNIQGTAVDDRLTLVFEVSTATSLVETLLRPLVLARPRHRRQLGRDYPPGRPRWPLRGHLLEVARQQGGPQQRERRMVLQGRSGRTRARSRGLSDREITD